MSRPGLLTGFCLTVLLNLPGLGVMAAPAAQWSSYGGDPQSTKYSPLEQINPANAGELEVAWVWESPDNALVDANRALTPIGFKSTPIIIGDALYISTSLGQVASLNAVSGEEVWRFDTRSWESGRPTNLGFNHRGVAYWKDGGEERILMPTNNGRLWSLNAKSGKPDPEFGEGGVVDLAVGLGREINRKE